MLKSILKLYTLLICVATVFLISCENNGPENNNAQLTPMVKYKLNNIQREIVGDEYYRISKLPNPDYLSVHLLYISIQTNEFATLLLVSNTTSDLTVGNYYTVPPISNGTSNMYVARMVLTTATPSGNVQKEYHGEFSDVTITGISNGYVSGTFNATLKLRDGTEQIFITEGEFSNYRVLL